MAPEHLPPFSAPPRMAWAGAGCGDRKLRTGAPPQRNIYAELTGAACRRTPDPESASEQAPYAIEAALRDAPLAPGRSLINAHGTARPIPTRPNRAIPSFRPTRRPSPRQIDAGACSGASSPRLIAQLPSKTLILQRELSGALDPPAISTACRTARPGTCEPRSQELRCFGGLTVLVLLRVRPDSYRPPGWFSDHTPKIGGWTRNPSASKMAIIASGSSPILFPPTVKKARKLESCTIILCVRACSLRPGTNVMRLWWPITDPRRRNRRTRVTVTHSNPERREQPKPPARLF